jgi:hypothetical protein
MFKHCLLLLVSFCSLTIVAQQPIEVGKAIDNKYLLTADTVILRKALQQTLGDGTTITTMHIESVGKWHYLIGNGTQRGYSKTIAVELMYDINTRTYFAVAGLAHKTCASAGCASCVPFKENGNIIGCHCKEVGTVSNECNFKTITNSAFYEQLKRYKGMKK